MEIARIPRFHSPSSVLYRQLSEVIYIEYMHLT